MTTQKQEREQIEQSAMQRAMARITALPPETQEALTLGRVFTLSGLFPDVASSAQAIVKILAGRELGFAPLYSMTHVYLIPSSQGPPQVYVSTEALAARLRSANIRIVPIEQTTERCTIRFLREGESHEVTYTIEQAKRAGLARDKAASAWVKIPETMLYWRAVRNAAKMYAPDVIANIEGVAEEVQERIDQQADFNRPKCAIHGVSMLQAHTGHWYCRTLVNGKYCQYQVPKPEAATTGATSNFAEVSDGEFENIEVLPEPAAKEQVTQDAEDLFGPAPVTTPSPFEGEASATILAPVPAASPDAPALVVGGEAPPESHGHPVASQPGKLVGKASGLSMDSVVAEVNQLLDFHLLGLVEAINAQTGKKLTVSWQQIWQKSGLTPEQVLELAKKIAQSRQPLTEM